VEAGSPTAGTVLVQIQVVDLVPQTLALELPTYLRSGDLTQRVARDAGLGAYWPDGNRRLFWLRARGRLMTKDETLGDLGVVRGELLHLLPQPPPGAQVVEQVPDYPKTRGYPASGNLALGLNGFWVVVWALAWGVALTVERNLWTVMIPGFALGCLSVSLARHLFGGEGRRVRVAGVGAAVALLLCAFTVVVPLFYGADPTQVVQEVAAGWVLALLGVLIGWLAWWGAVEPLPPRAEVEAAAELNQGPALSDCYICQQPVEPNVQTPCRYRCGQVFHMGCYQARASAAGRVEEGKCEICAQWVSGSEG
jgi:hypothetical protein